MKRFFYPVCDPEEEKAVEKQRRVYYIESGRRCGLTASKLEELKSNSGRPFIEERMQSRNFRRAMVMSEDGNYPVQYAYFCPANAEDSGCGWVVGEPRHDKKGYYCYICGVKIGEI